MKDRYAFMIITMLCICSCTDSMETAETNPWWMKQLEFIKQNKPFGENLSLISFHSLGTLKDTSDVGYFYKIIMNKTNFVPVYRGSINKYRMETWEQVVKEPCDNINVTYYTSHLLNILRSLPEVVKIYWDYCGTPITSYCIVSKETDVIEYDNIISHMILPCDNYSLSTKKIVRPTPHTKTGSVEETIGYKVQKEIAFKVGNNKIGAGISFTVYGKMESNTKSITKCDTSSFTYNYAGSSYKTISNLKTLQFNTGMYGNFEVAYGYGYASTDNSLSIVFGNDNRFHISDHLAGNTGYENVYPSYLEELYE